MLTKFFKPLEMDFWLPVAGLILLCAGIAYLLACKLRPKQEPDISAYKLGRIDLNAPLEGRVLFTGECSVCGLKHGSDTALTWNKQDCIDALLAERLKRGEHGRFAKRA